MRVLIVDDSPTMREITAAMLRAESMDVLEAEHGVEGLAVLERESVDCIITDLNMYAMGGLEFVTRVRAMPAFEFVPILFLTTETSEEFKEIGREVGASGWMTKPFEPAELVSAVRQLTQ